MSVYQNLCGEEAHPNLPWRLPVPVLASTSGTDPSGFIDAPPCPRLLNRYDVEGISQEDIRFAVRGTIFSEPHGG